MTSSPYFLVIIFFPWAPSSLVTSLPPLTSPSKASPIACPDTFVNSTNNFKITFEVFYGLIFGMIDFFLQIVSVLFSFGHDWVEYFACVFWAHIDDAAGAFLKFLPSFLGGVWKLGGFSFCDFAIDIVSCFCDSSFEIAAYRCEGLVKEMACFCDIFFDVVRIVDLVLLELGVVQIN